MKNEHYNWSLWYSSGGKDGEEPYTDKVKVCGVEKQRVFVDYELFPTWEKFSIAAQMAINAATLTPDIIHPGRYWKAPFALPLDNSPKYLIEPIPTTKGIALHIWINALCPNVYAFERITETAKAIRNMWEKEFEHDNILAGVKLNYSSVKQPQFCSLELRRSKTQQDIDGLLKRMGVE